MAGWKLFRKGQDGAAEKAEVSGSDDVGASAPRPAKWSLGILNDKLTDEVPGSVLLLSKHSKRNEPLGLQHAPARTSSSSLPSPFGLYPARSRSRTPTRPEKKKTTDGILLVPQPDDSHNDPLNWPLWRRNAALLSLGFYCMIGGGMTPILAAGFNNVAMTFDVSIPRVSLTTGLYMMGLGLGSVIMSPTAILYGKRPVYLATSILFILSSVWCALSPNYTSLAVARIVQGIAVSPVECLPSASVAEIFFLHERAYRLGIYTLLLLGGKNLIPLVSAAIIQSLGWRWVFWMVAIVVGFGLSLLFFFVPETFWDRTPRAKHITRPSSGSRGVLPSLLRTYSKFSGHHVKVDDHNEAVLHKPKPRPDAHVAFEENESDHDRNVRMYRRETRGSPVEPDLEEDYFTSKLSNVVNRTPQESQLGTSPDEVLHPEPSGTPKLTLRPPNRDRKTTEKRVILDDAAKAEAENEKRPENTLPTENSLNVGDEPNTPDNSNKYTEHYRFAPPKTYLQTLRIFSGRLTHDHWLRVAFRPFILFAYPAVLWSALIYSLSIGWLIVLSESISDIYKSRDTYNFTALQAGLVYLSPFIGGVLGTAVAGKFSDVVVRFMSRRNDGVYEPEFRLVMAIPVAITTTIGLMGFGWSAEERDNWFVPTFFFGLISFGCSLGSTTSITFAVDSYRQYAGEALVTLNFSKNILHGLVFSLFFTTWLQSDGSKIVFIAIGCIQMVCLLFTIPMYLYGKRARMWTVRKNLMERF